MSLERLISKYVKSAELVLATFEYANNLDKEKVVDVVDHAKTYLSDAKYYMQSGKLDTSLTSVAYCEGLLDALKLLGAVKFEWPTKDMLKEK